ncbi:MAG: FecR domain-containing protein [Lentisphaeraceae bacterium]|nr:FecR domain-containing protein [Lentisphaeraceae bacterium]
MNNELIDLWLHNDFADQQQRDQFLQLYYNDEEFQRHAQEQQQIHLTLQSFLNEEANEELVLSVSSRLWQMQNKDDRNEQAISRLKRTLKEKKKQRWVFPTLVEIACIVALAAVGFWLMPADLQQVAAGETRRFTLPSGAQVTLLGPVKYRLMQGNQFYLDSGVLRAKVPEKAKGFTVFTANGKIVDLGTEFSINALEERSLVKVLQGKVELKNKSDVKLSLSRGQSSAMHAQVFESVEAEDLYFDGRGLGRTININFGEEKNIEGLYSGKWNSMTSRQIMPLRDNKGLALKTEISASEFLLRANNELGEALNPIQRVFASRISNNHSIDDKNLPPLQIHINNIPFRKYSIIVYYWMRPRYDNHTFLLSVNGSREYEILRPLKSEEKLPRQFKAWSGPTREASGNYLRFSHQSATDTVILARRPPWNKNLQRSWFICAVQIIEE